MKHLKALCSVLVLGFIIFLCSCGKELPAVDGDFSVTVFKNAIEVTASFVDTEDHDLFYDTVRPYIVVENEDEDGVVTEVSRTAVSVTKPTVYLDPMGTKTEEKFTKDEVEYDIYVDSKDQKYYLSVSGEDTFITYLTKNDDGTYKAGTANKIVEIPTELSAEKVTVSNLTEGTVYTVKLIITASSKQTVLKTDTITTLDSGESLEDPIIINTLQELLGINKDNDGYYKLGADIVVDGTLSTIFNSSTIFKGHFDGDGHTISGYSISGNNYSGLFGNMFGATVKNLVLKDVKFNVSRGETYLGALAGYAKNCTIENVTVDGVEFTYSGRSSATAIIGGLVGEAENSTITNCAVKNIKTVISSAQLKVNVGGFVGLNDKSLIENCHVNGSIEATITYNANTNGNLLMGGFVGVNDSSKGIINSSAIVNLTVKEPATVTSSGVKTYKLAVGGFAGSNEAFHSKLSNCVAIGDIDVSAKFAYNVFIGGIVGDVSKAGVANLENCLYKAKENGIKATLMTVTETTEEEKIQKVYVSLTVGRVENANNSSVTNVIAYSDLMTLTNEHKNVVKAADVISTDIAAFNQSIQDIIKAN